jgi:hypothetical protein
MEMFHIEPDVATSLHDLGDAFVELREDPASDPRIELYIYICFLIFTRMGSMDYLERAIQRAEGWVAVIGDDYLDRTRRSEILDMMLAKTYERSYMLQDAER